MASKVVRMTSDSSPGAGQGTKRRRVQEIAASGNIGQPASHATELLIELPVTPAIPLSSEHPESSVKPRLSLLPIEDRRAQYMEKFREDYLVERSLVRDDFAGFGIISAFRALGWEGILEMRSMYYPQACRDFIAGIKSHSYESLTSEYRGAEVTFTIADVAAIARIDTAGPYERKWSTLDQSDVGFYSMVADLTGLSASKVRDGLKMRKRKGELPRGWLTPQARIFHKISETNLNPRTVNSSVRHREVFLIHALITGSPKYSLAYIILESWWEALEDPKKKLIPFCSILSRLLRKQGLIAPYHTYADGTERGDRLVIVGDKGAHISRATMVDISFDIVRHRLSIRTQSDQHPRFSNISPVTLDVLQSEMTPLIPPGAESPIEVAGPAVGPEGAGLQDDAPGLSEPASAPPTASMTTSEEYQQLNAAIVDLGARLEGQIASLGVQMALLHERMTAFEGRRHQSFQPQFPGDASFPSYTFQPAGDQPVPLRCLIKDPSRPDDDIQFPDLHENSLGCDDNGDSDADPSETSTGGCSLQGFRAKFNAEKGKKIQIAGSSKPGPVDSRRSSSAVKGSPSDSVNPTAGHGPAVEDAGTSMETGIANKELAKAADNETVGVWQGHVVGVEARVLLEAVECHYPNTFVGVRTCPEAIRLTILKEFCTVIKGFMETSVAELVEERLNSLHEDLHEFERFGFDLSWAHERLKMVEELKFGNSPLVQKLVALDESLKPMKERLVQQRNELKQAVDALEVSRFEYENAKIARNERALEVAKKLGADYDCVLKGHLGSGILPGY